MLGGVILGQTFVRLLDAALNDIYIYFFKNFYQKQFKYAMNLGVAQIRGVLLQIFIGKKCLFVSLSDAALNF